MSDFRQQALSLAAEQQAPAWLQPVRERGAGHWRAAAWPNRRIERWKYTPVTALDKNDFALQSVKSAGSNPTEKAINMDAYRLVFINGVFSAEASSELPAEVVRFAEANSEQTELISRYLGQLADSGEHLFAAMNEATLCDGILLNVPDNARLDKPVYLFHLGDESQAALASARLLVRVGKNAEAEVIEHFVTSDESQRGFLAAQTEIFLADGAQLQHYRLHLEDEGVSRVGGVSVELLRNSQLRAFTLAKGAALLRTDYNVFHRGEGAHADVQGIYLPRNKQLVDYHTNVQHCVGHCTTNEVFRGIIGDSAKAVFNGRIHIHADAQKTLAELSNKNLLTSNRAEVDTKPELEIYADDVRCAHGATVAQINEEALYYLQTRGIGREDAQTMLSFGFINELIEQVANPQVADYLLPQLTAQFGLRDWLSETAGEAIESL